MTEPPELEQLLVELTKVVKFKDITVAGDIVLIIADTPRTIIYAVINDIARDNAKKDEWWHVTMTALTVPPRKIVWTLRSPQFSGQEIFTMGGIKQFIQAVNLEETDTPPDQPEGKKTKLEPEKKPSLRVIK